MNFDCGAGKKIKTIKAEVINRHGIHQRPSMLLAELCSKFEDEMIVDCEGKSTGADAKNFLSIISMEAAYGDILTFHLCMDEETAENFTGMLADLKIEYINEEFKLFRIV